jgi:hypothetical protein
MTWITTTGRDKLLRRRCSRIHIRKRERQRDIGILLARNFHIGIHEVVQRRAILRRAQMQISPHCELHPVHIMRTKEVGSFLLVLPGLGDIDGNPSVLGFEEIGPAVITGNLR